MTYNQFFVRQSKSFQDEAIGKDEADQFRSGNLSITKFKERNQSMSLAELEESHSLSLNNPED